MMHEYFHIDDDKDIQFPGQLSRDNERMTTSDHVTSRNNNTVSLVSLRHSAIAAVETMRSHRVVKATDYGSEHCCGNTRGLADDGINEEIYRFVLHMLRWSHEQKCDALERLIRESELRILRSLWTTLQPALHRGFTYSVQRLLPSIDLSSTSTNEVTLEEARTDVVPSGQNASLVRSKTTITPRSTMTSSNHVIPRSANSAKTLIGSMSMNGHSSRVMMTSQEKRLTNRGDARTDEKRSTSAIQFTSSILIKTFSNCWQERQRSIFFRTLLTNLDEHQQYFLSSILELRLYRDFISLLPRPLAVHILCLLSVQQLASASQVSKKWRKMCKNGVLWKSKYIELYKEIPPHLTECNEKPLNWRKVYIKSCNVKENWTEGNYKLINCKGHNGRVLCVAFNKMHVATGSVDHTVKLWEIESGRCVQTLKSHIKGVWSVLFYTDNLLISGSYDSSIKIWNLVKGRCIRSLLGHRGPVWAMVRRGNVLVSVSQDRTAKVWDISRCLLKFSLEHHKDAVFAVDMDDSDSLIFTGSVDRTVRLWSRVTGQLLYTLNVSPTTAIMSIAYSNGYMACCYGTTICVYNITMNADVVGGVADVSLLRQYSEHKDRIENLQLKVKDVDGEIESTLISAGRDAVIKYWDLTVDEDVSLQTFSGHKEQINCVCFDSTRMASASYDNTIKIWDFFNVLR